MAKADIADTILPSNPSPPARLYGCPVEFALDVVGGKWRTVILARLKQEALRYGELRRLLPGLSDKVLTQRLRELVEAGLIERDEADGRARYELTDRGLSLQPALEALYAWGEREAATTGARFRSEPT